MNRSACVLAVLCLALAAHVEEAAGAVRVAIGGAAAAPFSIPVSLGSRPIGTIQSFVTELCFYEEGSSPASCNGSGTLGVPQTFAAPFYTAGIFRKNVATGETRPVSSPVSLSVGQRAILVNEWIATTLGAASSTQILRLTPTGQPAEELVVNASGNGTASEPCGFENPGLCLSDGRFRVEAHFVTATALEDSAHSLRLTTDTGYLFFFDPSNVEAVIKVLDGCGVNGHYWIFAGGLTDVRTDVTVTDLEHDVVQVYFNPQGTAFQPIQDTSAFATCP
jgi:hypothetical protein